MRVRYPPWSRFRSAVEIRLGVRSDSPVAIKLDALVEHCQMGYAAAQSWMSGVSSMSGAPRVLRVSDVSMGQLMSRKQADTRQVSGGG